MRNCLSPGVNRGAASEWTDSLFRRLQARKPTTRCKQRLPFPFNNKLYAAVLVPNTFLARRKQPTFVGRTELSTMKQSSLYVMIAA